MSKKDVLLEYLKNFLSRYEIESDIEINDTTEECTLNIENNSISFRLQELVNVYIQKEKEDDLGENEELVMDFNRTRTIIICSDAKLRLLI